MLVTASVSVHSHAPAMTTQDIQSGLQWRVQSGRVEWRVLQSNHGYNLGLGLGLGLARYYRKSSSCGPLMLQNAKVACINTSGHERLWGCC